MGAQVKIALVNSVLLNGGDAGIVYGTLDGIQEVLPAAAVTVFAHEAGVAARYYPDLHLQPMLFDAWAGQRHRRVLLRSTFRHRSRIGILVPGERRFLRALAGMDAIVYCGGGYLNESYNTRVVLDVMERTLDLGVPHMAYAHSIGPLYRETTRARVGRLLNRFAAVTVRDEASQALVRELAVESGRTHLLADAAFSMHVDGNPRLRDQDLALIGRVRAFKREAPDRPLILVSVREWRFPRQPDAGERTVALRTELRRLLQLVVAETDCRICFLSTCQGRPEYGYDDAAAAAALIEDLGIPGGRVLVCDGELSPRVYPALIRECADLVVSMRMHFIVFSILAGVPFVCLAYEKKSIELCSALGLSRYCHDVAEIDAGMVLTSIRGAFAEIDALRRILEGGLRTLAARSRQNAVVLAGLVRQPLADAR